MTKRTDILHELTLWGAIGSIIAMVFAVYFFMDERHASTEKVTSVEIELRQEILDTDIDRNAKILHHYQQKSLESELSKADQNRLKYIELQLDRQYEQQDRLKRLDDELE